MDQPGVTPIEIPSDAVPRSATRRRWRGWTFGIVALVALLDSGSFIGALVMAALVVVQLSAIAAVGHIIRRTARRVDAAWIALAVGVLVGREAGLFTVDWSLTSERSIRTRGEGEGLTGRAAPHGCRFEGVDSDVGRAMVEALRCPVGDEVVIVVSGLDDPACYTPLYKRGSVDVRVSVRRQGREAAYQEVSYALSISGIVSCLSLRRRLGFGLATEVRAMLPTR